MASPLFRKHHPLKIRFETLLCAPLFQSTAFVFQRFVRTISDTSMPPYVVRLTLKMDGMYNMDTPSI